MVCRASCAPLPLLASAPSRLPPAFLPPKRIIDMEQLPQRSFPRPQGAISSLQKDLYVVQRAASNEDLLKLIRAGNYVLLHGNRMCGKSTRVLQIIEHNTGEFRGLWCVLDFAYAWLMHPTGSRCKSSGSAGRRRREITMCMPSGAQRKTRFITATVISFPMYRPRGILQPIAGRS